MMKITISDNVVTIDNDGSTQTFSDQMKVLMSNEDVNTTSLWDTKENETTDDFPLPTGSSKDDLNRIGIWLAKNKNSETLKEVKFLINTRIQPLKDELEKSKERIQALDDMLASSHKSNRELAAINEASRNTVIKLKYELKRIEERSNLGCATSQDLILELRSRNNVRGNGNHREALANMLHAVRVMFDLDHLNRATVDDTD